MDFVDFSFLDKDFEKIKLIDVEALYEKYKNVYTEIKKRA